MQSSVAAMQCQLSKKKEKEDKKTNKVEKRKE
jgi:hypothetical protein